jgi:predicted nucleic-acid-binding protein
VQSVDTNVIARYLIGDDLHQSPLAEQVLSQGTFISLTVLLETYWLLSSRYGMKAKQIIALFNVLHDHQMVQIEAEEWLDWLLDRLAHGGDFADLIHLVSSQNKSSFVTFDKAIAKHADKKSPVPVIVLR